jgi:predicted nucleotidyltransferase
VDVPTDAIIDALRAAGARFALLHGSRSEGSAREDSDIDVGAYWGADPPKPWEVDLPDGVDLVVLDGAPLWLAGRIALRGVLLFDDDPPRRVAWQADTRLRYLDDLPQVLESQREWREAVARGR